MAMDSDGAALSKRIMACLANVEVEAVGAGDIAFRSALRKSLSQAQVVGICLFLGLQKRGGARKKTLSDR